MKTKFETRIYRKVFISITEKRIPMHDYRMFSNTSPQNSALLTLGPAENVKI